MKVLLTGATGYIGSVIAEKLQNAGHHVSGLARSEASAAVLESLGIEVVHGDLDSVEILVEAPQKADAVIHTAFDLGNGDFDNAVAKEKLVVRAFIKSLTNTNKPLIVTSGTAVLGDTGDRVFDEETAILGAPKPGMGAILARLEMEQEVLQAKDVHGVVLRPPNVYGRSNGRAILTLLTFAAHALGAVPFASGTADHKWTFVHVEDLADLYVLALEKAKQGELFHAGAQSGLRTKSIAEALSTGIGLGGKTAELDIPALGSALGAPPLAGYWANNSQSSSEKARRVLGWKPKHEDLLGELAKPKPVLANA
jgi:nucleoside-diphosphate-sugar epimerase